MNRFYNRRNIKINKNFFPLKSLFRFELEVVISFELRFVHLKNFKSIKTERLKIKRIFSFGPFIFLFSLYSLYSFDG